MIIQIKNLDYIIKDKKILNNINLSLEGKKIIGILGPNGSGKTSLLKHIYREIDTEGKIFVDGVDISTINSRKFFQKVSVLTQFQKEMDLNLRVEEVLLMGRYPYKKFFSSYDDQDYKLVDQAIKNLKLKDLRTRSVKNLSGGEFQRVMLAKALVSQPQLIILDEPTNHLDIKYKVELMETLKKFNALCLISLHDLEMAVKFCDEIIILKEGKLIHQGQPKTILTEELLLETFSINYKILRNPEFIIYY
ncbi:ABC transporter ATP-binding protein [Citroniella saccharovorans]|uniref:ABC transporter ATP-binding protein n=1 Tax=Citroniella saccharovorans TaxID=2053367 RepID=A0AAW9MRA3_9FIRM|nr:ABC transporter ATP-binding protein [Citroniella saccharovorans]MEB3428485.1 ABC transporter ATP-binding protein [Citroniella saccharovorans]